MFVGNTLRKHTYIPTCIPIRLGPGWWYINLTHSPDRSQTFILKAHLHQASAKATSLTNEFVGNPAGFPLFRTDKIP